MVQRISSSLVLAVTVTFGLFFLMQALIATGRVAISEPPPPVVVKMRPVIEPTPPNEPEDRLPVRPKDILPPTIDPVGPAEPTGPGVIPIGPVPVPPVPGGGTAGPIDGGLIPIVRAQPIYPMREQAKGTEGYVVLAYDVTPQGIPANIQVVAAEPSGAFEKAAITALEKFRYRPRVQGGREVATYGLQFQFTFTLED